MAIIDVIKYEGKDSVLIWKHPKEDFNTSAQLIVEDPWIAIVYFNGIPSQPYFNGKYTLETGNIPFVRRIVESITGGVSPNRYRVFFINPEYVMPVTWGVSSPITVMDPVFGLPIHASAHGEYYVRISNIKTLLNRLSGTMTELNEQVLKDRFGGQITAVIYSSLTQLINLQRITYRELGDKNDSLAKDVEPQISNYLFEYGLSIERFSIQKISIINDEEFKALVAEENKRRDEADAIRKEEVKQAVQKIDDETIAGTITSQAEANKTAIIKEAEGNKEATRLNGEGRADSNRALGVSELDYMDHEVIIEALKAAGKQNNSMPSAYANPMLGSPMVGSIDNSLNDLVNNAVQRSGMQRNRLRNSTCSNCGATIADGSYYCRNCGRKVVFRNINRLHCPNCGAIVPEDNYCIMCGTCLIGEMQNE